MIDEPFNLIREQELRNRRIVRFWQITVVLSILLAVCALV